MRTIWVLEVNPFNIGTWIPALQGPNELVMAWPDGLKHKGVAVAKQSAREQAPLRVARYVRVDEGPCDTD